MLHFVRICAVVIALSSLVLSEGALSIEERVLRRLSQQTGVREARAATVNLAELVSVSALLAQYAGQIIREVSQSKQLACVEKDGEACKQVSDAEASKTVDPQTRADRTSQQVIVGKLKQKFPQLANSIRSEENDVMELSQAMLDKYVVNLNLPVVSMEVPAGIANLDVSKVVVWIDPLDGTRDFVQSELNAVTTLIGVAYEGRPIAGVISRPFGNQRTIWGIVGMESVYDLETGVVPIPSDRARRIGTTASHLTKELMRFVKDCNPTETIHSGGAGSKALMLLEGTIDAWVYPTWGTKRWDSCACEAILNTVGGILTDRSGRIYDYSHNIPSEHNFGGVVATLGGADYHKTFIETTIDINQHYLNAQFIESLFQAKGIDTTQWTKSPEELVGEMLRGETVLWKQNGQIVRRIRVVVLRIHRENSLDSAELRELKKFNARGKLNRCDNPLMEKMLGDEEVETAVSRAIKEELHPEGNVNVNVLLRGRPEQWGRDTGSYEGFWSEAETFEFHVHLANWDMNDVHQPFLIEEGLNGDAGVKAYWGWVDDEESQQMLSRCKEELAPPKAQQ